MLRRLHLPKSRRMGRFPQASQPPRSGQARSAIRGGACLLPGPPRRPDPRSAATRARVLAGPADAAFGVTTGPTLSTLSHAEIDRRYD